VRKYNLLTEKIALNKVHDSEKMLNPPVSPAWFIIKYHQPHYNKPKTSENTVL